MKDRKFIFETILLSKDSSLGWNFFFYVPKAVSEQLMPNHRRVICTINEILTYHCALFPGGEEGYYITVNKQNRKQLDLVAGDPMHIKLQPDTSKYGLPMPAIFEEVLHQDPEGSERFDDLTPGIQRSLIHIVARIKSEHLQAEKALVILEYIKSFAGSKVDFSGLHKAFRSNRFKR